MVRKVFSILILVVLITSGIQLCFPFIDTVSADPPTEVYVDDDAAPEWYDVSHVKTIQEGIDNVSEGGTVYVYNGTYTGDIVHHAGTHFTVLVNKSLNLVGESKYETIIDTSDNSGVCADTEWVNISNFNIWNGSGVDFFSSYGSYIPQDNRNVSNCIVSNCIIHDIDVGVYIRGEASFGKNFHTSYITVSNCEIYNASMVGIWLLGTAAPEVYNNTIINNTIHDVKFAGIWLDEANKVYNNVIIGNTIYNCDWFDFAGFGGIIVNGEDNSIISNNIYDNLQCGIYVVLGANNQIYYNTLTNNTVNNGQDDGTNSAWNSISMGNRWSNYDENSEGAWDINSDGIADTPYLVPGTAGAYDYYPIMPIPNYPPAQPTNETPANNSLNVSLYLTMSVNVSDANNDLMNVSFYWGNGVLIRNDTNVSSGDKAFIVSTNLRYKTKYYWYVVIDDGNGGTTRGPASGNWTFTTRKQPTGPAGKSIKIKIQENRPAVSENQLDITSVILSNWFFILIAIIIILLFVSYLWYRSGKKKKR